MIYAIREMRPRLDARAREIEAARRVPTDILDELQRLGVFRMNAPRSHGGLELPLRESCAVVAELAKIDGSVGWVVMIGSFASLLLGRLPRPMFDHIYRDGPDVRVAGSVARGARPRSLRAVTGSPGVGRSQVVVITQIGCMDSVLPPRVACRRRVRRTECRRCGS
jgi:hypothetical protein